MVRFRDDRTRELWQVNRNLWLCVLFVGAMIPWARSLGFLRGPHWAPWLVYGVAVANATLRTYVGWRKRGQPDSLAWAFTVADTALISVGVWLTGGIESEIWPVYIVLVVAETVVCPRPDALALAGLAIAGYAAATWGDRGEPGYAFTFCTRLFFGGLAATFARRIGALHLRRAAEVATLREEVAASTERSRIAREVHDSLGHAMVASILRVELCSRLVRHDPAEAERILKEEAAALREAWNEGRDLAFRLQPWSVGSGGIAAALRRHAGKFAGRAGLVVDTACPDDVTLPDPVEVAVLRIAQEALTNVARHSRATRARVTLARQGTAVTLIVEDDGVGAPPGTDDSPRGIAGMRHRAEELGARSWCHHARPEGPS